MEPSELESSSALVRYESFQSRLTIPEGTLRQAIAIAGPGSVLLSYFVVGLFVYSVVITLWVFQFYRPYGVLDCYDRAEMSAMYPVSRAFSTFGSRFVSPSLGFTLGVFVAFKPTLLVLSICMNF